MGSNNIKNQKHWSNAFTLAEVLITLGVIGVVTAVTMPTLVTNIQERVRKEQVRTVKYKLTKATEKMKSLGKIGPYEAPATKNFVNELKKHMTIAKVCDGGNIGECWPTNTINVHTAENVLTPTSISTLEKGTGLKALAISSGNEDTVGIVTGDGVPMLLVYSPKCQALDEVKTYTWSVEDGKPVTNATTNCISAIFDINGAKGPNRVGQDIRTLNSVFGSVNLGLSTPASKSDCEKMKSKFGITGCEYEQDYWVGAIAACDKLGLHIPNMSTLANLANARYGTTLIGTYTFYFSVSHSASRYNGSCKDFVLNEWDNGDPWRVKFIDECIRGVDMATDPNAGYQVPFNHYWAREEYSSTASYVRYIGDWDTNWYYDSRNLERMKTLCVAD